jgi:hypothetical protein
LHFHQNFRFHIGALEVTSRSHPHIVFSVLISNPILLGEKLKGGERQEMSVKIALLTLLVISAAATMVATTVAAFNEVPSTTSIETDFEETFGYLTLSGEVQPEGDPVGGDWPIPG